MNAGTAGIPALYSCSYQYYFVIGGDGIVRWRGAWNQATVAAQVQAALDDLATTGVGDLPGRGFALGANFPNPFNPSTTIPYDLRGDGGEAEVRLEILDLRGRVIRTLVSERQARGRSFTAVWDGRDTGGQPLASGLYLSRLSVDGEGQERMLTLVK